MHWGFGGGMGWMMVWWWIFWILVIVAIGWLVARSVGGGTAASVAKMNAAQGQARVDAIAAVVTELAAQRKVMQERMMGMGQMMGMMGRMGQTRGIHHG